MHLAHEQVELGRARTRVGAQDRGVQAVRLHREADRVFHDRLVGPQLATGVGRAGERYHVLPGDVVQQVADAAADQLQRAVRQDAHAYDPPHHQFRQVGGLRGGLHEAGHPRNQRRRDLFQHSPDGKVEGVDVDRDAAERRQDVLRREAAVLRQWFHRALGQDADVRQFPPRPAGEGQKRADPALDVRPGVLRRRPGREAFGVKVVLHVHQRGADGLQHQRALVDRVAAQRRAAHFAAPAQRAREVETVRGDCRVRLASRGVQERLALARAPAPAAQHIAFQLPRGPCPIQHVRPFPQASFSAASVAAVSARHRWRNVSLSVWRRPMARSRSKRSDPAGPNVSATRGIQ